MRFRALLLFSLVMSLLLAIACSAQQYNATKPCSGGQCCSHRGYSGIYPSGDHCNDQHPEKHPCPLPGEYYGRGPIQLSWNFNYTRCGDDLGVDMLHNPAILIADAVLSFKSAILFRGTEQSPKPSCHEVIIDQWAPSQSDIDVGRLPGHGLTTNIINGGVECGPGSDANVEKRIGLFTTSSEKFAIEPADVLDCDAQQPRGSAISAMLTLIALLVCGVFKLWFPFLGEFVSFVKEIMHSLVQKKLFKRNTAKLLILCKFGAFGLIVLFTHRFSEEFQRHTIVGCFFSVCVFATTLNNVLRSQRRNEQLPLPPGPTPWPIVGSLPEMMRNKPTFRWIHSVMQEVNTNIACFRLGNVHVIPVTSPEIAREVLKDNDSVFASRPISMATEYASRGYLTTALVPWGEQWKKMRKVITSDILSSARLHRLLVKRTEEADNLVRFIYNQCKSSSTGTVVNVRLATRQYTGNVIRKMMFNRRYFGEGKEDGGPGCEEEAHVESLFTVLDHLYSFILSDYIPRLRLFDAEGHEKIVSEALSTISKYHDPIIDERVKQLREHGKKKKEEAEDLLDAFILSRNADGKPSLSVEEIKAQCTELMIATVDNPSNAAEWTIAEMINQPDLLKKATEEIDRVVGKDRLVKESDIPQLNFVKACLREAFRLHPIAPFNVPHVSIRDATIAGYFIPKGSHVLLSRLGLGRNPEVWEDPLKFKPERHMKNMDSADHDHQVELTEPELKFISFSRGRRGCMGVALGSEMAVMLLARLLQGFDWTVPLDKEKIDLTESKYNLFLAQPLHAHATPRLPAEIYPAN